MWRQERLCNVKNIPELGPYYPVVTIGTVPRAYDIFTVYEGMKK
jgi:hypothetical protein